MDTTVDKIDNKNVSMLTFDLACPHSRFEQDCFGCWAGHAAMLESQLRKLEASTALPVRERIEKAVRQQMEHCYQVYKGVPPTVEDWVGGALYYVMWGIERDLPLLDAPNTRQRAEQAAVNIAKMIERETNFYVGSHQRREMADIIAAEFDK